MEYKKHINIRIKEDQFLRLMKTVEEHETNLSELIRRLIDRYEKQKMIHQKNKKG
jgi:predicted CopG family antitoxin